MTIGTSADFRHARRALRKARLLDIELAKKRPKALQQ
jgi:hypothetical protein